METSAEHSITSADQANASRVNFEDKFGDALLDDPVIKILVAPHNINSIVATGSIQ